MVKKSVIPKNRILIFFIVSLLCSIAIFASYYLWPILSQNFEYPESNVYFWVSMILAVFSFLASVLILLLDEIKPLYIPTSIWVGILIIYALISGIYLIILPALVQLMTDIWFYRKLKDL